MLIEFDLETHKIALNPEDVSEILPSARTRWWSVIVMRTRLKHIVKGEVPELMKIVNKALTPAEEKIRDMACEQLLLAFAKGELAEHTEWDDLGIALDYAKSAMPGRYEKIVAELKEQD
jgi:hypothetical protein